MVTAAKDKLTGRGQIQKLPDGSSLLFNYDIDSAVIKPEHVAFLEKNVLDRAKTSPRGLRVVIGGQADRLGDAGHNIALSNRRIDAIIAFLKRRLPRFPFDFKGFGQGVGEDTAKRAGDADNTRGDLFRSVIIEVLEPGAPIPPKPSIPNNPTPPEPAVALPLDIFVYFRGAPPAKQGTRDTEVEAAFKTAFNTEEYLKTHQPAVPICIFGGRGVNDKSTDAVNEVKALRAKTKDGVTIIRGDSIGGLTALKAATQLTLVKDIKLNYVAIDDAAFFADDDNKDVESFKPLKFRIPGPIIADRKENFFQTFGHELLTGQKGPGGFMPGTEFHGPIDGFAPRDMGVEGANTKKEISQFNALEKSKGDGTVRLATRVAFAGRLHEAAHKDADPLIDAVLKQLINRKLTPT